MVPDISEHQGTVDWAALGAAYRVGAIEAVGIRAGFGTARADNQFAANQAGARAQGIPAIYYWFNYPTFNTPQAEAAFFNNVVGKLQPSEAMAGDFEDDPASVFPRGQAGVDWAKAFLTAVQAPQNATWWYTYPFLLTVIPFSQLYGIWPFWVADYSTGPDSAWPAAIARQFTSCGSTPGVAGCCDQSRVLKGPLSQWLTPGGTMTQDQINAFARVLIALFKGRTPFDQTELNSIIGQLTPGNFEATVTAFELAAEYSGPAGVAELTLKNRLDHLPTGTGATATHTHSQAAAHTGPPDPGT